jgi:predicted DNA-binding protein (UPF0251 family)
MPRPEKERQILKKPGVRFFKPQGIPLRKLQITELTFDELEAMRLCYKDGHYQHDAARFMNVSRQTVGRILNTAMAKVTNALVNGDAIAITGGNVNFAAGMLCPECKQEYDENAPNCEDCHKDIQGGRRKAIEKVTNSSD